MIWFRFDGLRDGVAMDEDGRLVPVAHVRVRKEAVIAIESESRDENWGIARIILGGGVWYRVWESARSLQDRLDAVSSDSACGVS